MCHESVMSLSNFCQGRKLFQRIRLCRRFVRETERRGLTLGGFLDSVRSVFRSGIRNALEDQGMV
ncbi:MAG: hypothetical protein JWP89_3212 [Schlesneria sp.]|nr:hypothetical protein [Schlesneria sp.]